MSRVGKNAVQIPSGVTVNVEGRTLAVKGKVGELKMTINDLVNFNISNGSISFSPIADNKKSRTLWGTTRNLASNLIKGVSEGYTVNLDINGVGYRAAVQGKEVVLQLGYSHEIRYSIPEGIKVTCEKPTMISLFGANKQALGQMASNIIKYRPREPYKDKGIKVEGAYNLRKEGKKK